MRREKHGHIPSGPLVGRSSRFFALATLLLSLAGVAQAVLTTHSFSPTPADLYDLDHHKLYTWRLDTLPDVTITSAKLTFSQIANWDTSPNKLFVHLLD